MTGRVQHVGIGKLGHPRTHALTRRTDCLSRPLTHPPPPPEAGNIPVLVNRKTVVNLNNRKHTLNLVRARREQTLQRNVLTFNTIIVRVIYPQVGPSSLQASPPPVDRSRLTQQLDRPPRQPLVCLSPASCPPTLLGRTCLCRPLLSYPSPLLSPCLVLTSRSGTRGNSLLTQVKR